MLSGPAAISANIETLIERCGAGSGDKVRQSPFFYKPLENAESRFSGFIHREARVGWFLASDRAAMGNLMRHSRAS